MEIRATDLRIGNLLKPKEEYTAAYGEFNTGAVTKIKEGKFIVSNHYPGKWFEAIPLTEDWLRRLGFKETPAKIEEHISYYNGDIIIFWHEKLESIGRLYGYNQRRVYIRYVHQLQNLYFALTEEELNLK